MGTSASGGGAGGTNPLIPSWIGVGGGFPPPEAQPNPPNPDDDATDSGQQGNEGDSPGDVGDVSDNANGNQLDDNTAQQNSDTTNGTNRYRQPRIQFNKFVRSGGSNAQAFKNALKGYSRNAAGSTWPW